MVEAVESRMQDWSKLELVGKPLAFSDDENDESREQTDSENKISDSDRWSGPVLSDESEEEEQTNSEIIETSEIC